MLLWVLLALGCGDKQSCEEVQALPDYGDVLAVGDSLLAWHAPYCRSVPDYLATARGSAVENAAVNGAQMTSGADRIPEQYRGGGWSWLVADGGGNDLNQQCTCGFEDDCGWVLDRLADPTDWSGAMPALAERALGDGARVILVGYYGMPESAWYGLGDCGAELDALKLRYADYAAATPGVTYVDLARAVSWPEDRDAYDFDRVHPDPAGAEALGRLLAEVMAEQEQ